MTTVRSDFTLRTIDLDGGRKLHLVVDDDLGNMSVTNDAEAVVEAVGPAPGDIIRYRDSELQWDELRHQGGKFVRFAALSPETRERMAKRWLDAT